MISAHNVGLGVHPDSVRGWFAQHHSNSLPNGREVINGPLLALNEWKFIAASWDQNARVTSLHVDHDVSSTEPLGSGSKNSSGIAATGKNSTVIGKFGSNTQAFNGIIDNVFIFDTIHPCL